MIRTIHLVVILSSLLLSTSARADFIVTNQLTGDFRAGNPDNLIVDVTVSVLDATPGVASWLVDINSPLHSNAKLASFFFNLDLPSGVTASFSNFAPNISGKQWSGFASANNATGSGSANFDFGVAQSGPGNPNANQVNNSTSLTFDLTLSSGIFLESMFTGAAFSTGGGIPAGGAQMGAHLQALTASGSESDSGFPSGNNSIVNPEPSSLLLAGVGAIGCCAGAWRRRRAMSRSA
jgi:hypothetical protein